MADYSLVKGPDGTVEGVWLRDTTLAQDRTALIFLAMKEGLSQEIQATIAASGYRVVPNTYDSSGGCFVMWGSTPVPGEKAAAEPPQAESVPEAPPQPVEAPLPEQKPLESVSEPPSQPPEAPAPTPEQAPEQEPPAAEFQGVKKLQVIGAMIIIGFLLSIPCLIFGGIVSGALAAWLWIRWEKTPPDRALRRGTLAGLFSGIGSYIESLIGSSLLGAFDEGDLIRIVVTLVMNLLFYLLLTVAAGAFMGYWLGQRAKAKQAKAARTAAAQPPTPPRPTTVPAGERPAANRTPQPAFVIPEKAPVESSPLKAVLAAIEPDGLIRYTRDRVQALQWYAQKGFPQHDHDDETWLRWYDGMAQSADQKGIWDEAWAAFHHALAGYLPKNAPDIPRICWHLGRAHIGKGTYDLAALYLEAGQRLSDPEQDIALIGHVLIEKAVLANLTRQPDDYQAALERLNAYFVLPSGPGAAIGEKAAQSAFGDGHTNHKWLDHAGQPIPSYLTLAAAYYQVSLDMNRGLGNKQGIAFNLANLGDVWRKLGDKEKALACWAEAIPYLKETDDQGTIEKLRQWQNEL